MSDDQIADQVSNETQTADAGAGLGSGRECGTCTLCCKVVGVLEIAKPAGVWCRHCVRGKGCEIYDTRFSSCRTFYCQWMIDKGLGPEWKPERAKFALVKTDGGSHLTACVDPGFPSAWQRSPYYESLKRWAVEATLRSPDLHLVDVRVGNRCIVILPDRDVDIGILAADEVISLEARPTGAGTSFEVRKVKRQGSDQSGRNVFDPLPDQRAPGPDLV